MSLLRANWAKQSTLRYDKKRLDLYKVKFLFSFVFPCPRCNVNLRFNHALPNPSWMLIYANQSLINRSLTVSKLCYVTLKNLLFTQKIDDFVLRVGKVYQCRLVEIWNLSSRQEHCLLWLIAMEIFFVKAGRTSWIVCYNCSRQRCCPNLWWRYLQHLLWNLPTFVLFSFHFHTCCVQFRDKKTKWMCNRAYALTVLSFQAEDFVEASGRISLLPEELPSARFVFNTRHL